MLNYTINQLTLMAHFFLRDIKIFGRFNGSITVKGSHKDRDAEMDLIVSGGAEAVRAINGALVSERKPPMQS